MARAALSWSAENLATAAGTSVKSVFRFELGQVSGPIIAARFRTRLEKEGLRFGAARSGWSVSLHRNRAKAVRSRETGVQEVCQE